MPRFSPLSLILAPALALALVIVAGLVPAPARAGDMVPGLVYALGQKFDKSFNEAAFTGARRFADAAGLRLLEVEPKSAAGFESAVTALVRRGATDIAVIGYYYATPLAGLAQRHLNVRFTLVDAVAPAPNVRAVVFKEQEGAFLCGLLAAMKASSGTVGFVGALDIPLIRRYIAGYRAGARFARTDAEVLVNFVGTTPAAFNDPGTAAEVARSQFQRGAEVTFAGAGVSNLGIFQAAHDTGRLAIGVDSNQNGVFPGTILTSMLKRVDLAVERSFQASHAGTWTSGVVEMGLADGGIDIAIDEANRPLLTPAMLDRLATARRDIVDGRLSVPGGGGEP
jgi:basic membrane protein A